MAGEAAGDSSPREEGLLGAGDTSKPVTFSASRCSKIAPCSLKHWLCQEGGCFPRQQLGSYVPGRHLLAKSTPLTSQQCCELPGGASPSSNSQQPTAFTGSEAAFLLCPCCCPLFLERWGAGLSTSSCCHSFASPAKRALGCPLSGQDTRFYGCDYRSVFLSPFWRFKRKHSENSFGAWQGGWRPHLLLLTLLSCSLLPMPAWFLLNEASPGHESQAAPKLAKTLIRSHLD